MKQIVLATNNDHKISEIKFIIGKLPIRVLNKNDFNNFPDVKETGKVLEENAILKAKAIYEFTKIPALADDSGLEVDYLGGDPGVNSARYAGPGCSFQDNNEKLLKALKDVPEGNRQATFRCVIAICFGENEMEVVQGKVIGSITTEIRGQEGFGYDPLFYVPYYKKTFAEISPGEKNKISHRAIAINKARDLLIKKFALKLETE